MHTVQMRHSMATLFIELNTRPRRSNRVQRLCSKRSDPSMCSLKRMRLVTSSMHQLAESTEAAPYWLSRRTSSSCRRRRRKKTQNKHTLFENNNKNNNTKKKQRTNQLANRHDSSHHYFYQISSILERSSGNFIKILNANLPNHHHHHYHQYTMLGPMGMR